MYKFLSRKPQLDSVFDAYIATFSYKTKHRNCEQLSKGMLAFSSKRHCAQVQPHSAASITVDSTSCFCNACDFCHPRSLNLNKPRDISGVGSWGLSSSPLNNPHCWLKSIWFDWRKHDHWHGLKFCRCYISFADFHNLFIIIQASSNTDDLFYFCWINSFFGHDLNCNKKN